MRTIQYSRDRRAEPRRRAYWIPGGACHRARRRRDPVAGNDIGEDGTPPWLDPTILAIHATSLAAILSSAWEASSGCNSRAFAVRRFSVATLTSPVLVFTTTRSPLWIGAPGATRMMSPSR